MSFSVNITRLAFAIALGIPLSAAADPSIVICTDLHDSDATRAVLTVDLDAGIVSGLEVVTPDLLWSDPDQPETRRFAAGKTDVSPDLAIEKDVAIRTTRDAEGELRIVDFAVTRPMALEFEGFRGSILLHDGFFNKTAYGSLYYSATGNVLSISPLVCKRL
jgi:diadenosine tetraphosphatase ApaH/serine/threonine PP2A family protein phosphatase